MKRLPMISIVSLPLSIVADFSRYLYQDWEFAKWIAVAVAVDTVLGIVKHLMHKDVSSSSFFSKFGKKITDTEPKHRRIDRMLYPTTPCRAA